MIDAGARSTEVWRWVGIGLSAIGYPMLAVIGPAVIVAAAAGYEASWTPAERWLVVAFGVFLSVVLDSVVVLGLRSELLGRPRAVIGHDGIHVARARATWDELGASYVVLDRRALAIEVPPAMVRRTPRLDRFLASLNPTAANGMRILYLTGRQLGMPVADALRRVPPDHRRA